MKSKKLAQLVTSALEDMKGQSIRCINVEKLTTITDYMVIATGTSNTHIRALADSVVVKLKDANQKTVGVEGKMQAEWVLVDAGGVVVHIMMAPVRALYNLEDLWDFKSQKVEDQQSDSASDKIGKPVSKTTKTRVTNTRKTSKPVPAVAKKKTRTAKPGKSAG